MSTSVVVVGASGYIGAAVALAFRRAGYRVYGVVRHEEKAKILKQNEVHVVVGDIASPEGYQNYLKEAAIVVDAVGDEAKLLEKVIEVTKGKSIKTLYIATSGILVHSNSGHFIDETSTSTNPLLEKRSNYEKLVTSSKDVRGVVLRPGFVYGGAGGFFADGSFAIKENEDLVMIGSKEKRWSWVHVEDLADAYVRIAKVGHVVDGEFFDITGPWTPTYEEILVAFAKATGWKGKIVHVPEVPKDNFFAQILESDSMINSQKAFNLLGWRETHLGPVAEADTYYTAWKAIKSK